MLNIKKALVSLLALSVAVLPASASLPATQLSYDSASRVASMQTGVGATTNYGYDGLGNLASEQWPGGGVLQYAHRPTGGLSGVVDPRGISTSYVSNGFGEATVVQSPDGGLENRTYDEAGNLKSRSFGTGATQHFSYDAENRLTSVNSGDAQTTFQYDTAHNGAGRLASMQDNSGATSWAYDVHGNVVSRSQSINGAPGAFNLIFSYDAGRVTSITYPSGRVVSYTYEASRVTSIKVDGQTVISNVQYQPFGPPVSWQMGAIGTYSRSFDTAGRIVSHTHENGQRQLTWDAASRPTSMQNPDGSTWTFGYDVLDRLTLANQGALGSRTYGLDWVGNRTSQTENGTNYAFGVDSGSNRLTTASTPTQTYSYQYDAAGRIIGDGVRTFGWTNAGLLATATKGVMSANYFYNGFEQRVKKVTSQTTRYYVYAEDGLSLLGEYEQGVGGAVSALNEIVYLQGIPVAVLHEGLVNFIQVDHLETPRTIKNAAGAVVWRWESDAFGVGEPNQNPSGLYLFEFNGRLSGQQLDSETGLHFNNARYYDPSAGRYLSSDPIGLQGGLNNYAYVHGSPLVGSDPEGLWAQLAVGAGAGALVGGVLGGVQAYYTGTSVLRGTISGAAGGAVYGMILGTGQIYASGLFNGSLISSVGLSATAGFFGNVTTQLVDDCSVNWLTAGESALLASGLFFLRPFTAVRQNVVQWAPAGRSPTFAGNSWVMTGEQNVQNKLLSGTVHGKYNYPYNNSLHATFEATNLSYPRGWQKIKGLFGQRQIN